MRVVGQCQPFSEVFTPPTPGKYTPEVGDVVEFGEKIRRQAIVYKDKQYGLSTMDNSKSYPFNRVFSSKEHKNLRKIGEIDASGLDHYEKARKAATKYFSESPEVGSIPELRPEGLKQGDIITVECKDGSVKTGCVVDRSGFEHAKALILRSGFTSWEKRKGDRQILKIQSRLGSVPTSSYLDDTSARSLLKDFLFKSSPKKHEFKVGEKVIVVKAGDDGHSVGTIGIIVNARSARNFDVEANKKTYWHNSENITLFRG